MSTLILHGDVRTALQHLADESVHCVVTSPPYFGLRDYQVAGQIGLEPTPTEYVAELVGVFREIARVLHPLGTAWLNLGDSYATSGGMGKGGNVQRIGRGHVQRNERPGRARGDGQVKPKELYGIPWRVAFALQDDGWYLRSDIIWVKPNPMPESVKDRPTSAHEHVFLLMKQEDYFYDSVAVAEPAVSDHGSGNGFKRPARKSYEDKNGARGSDEPWSGVGTTRNRRNVWTIRSAPFKEAHFATMPPALAEVCILAGSSEFGCCPTCLSPWERVTAKGEPDLAAQRAAGGDANGEYHGSSRKGHAAAGVQDASAVKARVLEGMRPVETVGWRMMCDCPLAKPIPCTVLDPFGGSGTTAMVARRHQREAVMVELNPEYVDIAKQRLAGDGGMLDPVRVVNAMELPSKGANAA